MKSNAEDETEARSMDEIIEMQGWSDESLVALLREYLALNDLTVSATAFLQRVADEENGHIPG